jgi:hypothetical protein
METTGEHCQIPVSKESQLMQDLVLGIVGDLGRLLKEHGLGQKPIKIIEALVFAMFLVTETYTAAKRGPEAAREGLDPFHEDMVEYIFKEYFYKNAKARDMEEVEARMQELNQLINDRYQEYRQNFYEDYQDQKMSFHRTFTTLAGHLLGESLPDGEEKDRLVSVFSVKLAHFWSGCMTSFSPRGN